MFGECVDCGDLYVVVVVDCEYECMFFDVVGGVCVYDDVCCGVVGVGVYCI